MDDGVNADEGVKDDNIVKIPNKKVVTITMLLFLATFIFL